MARHRTDSIEFKRQVVQEFLAGETLYGLAKRHDVSRNLIRVWVAKYEAGAFNDEAQAGDLLQHYEAMHPTCRVLSHESVLSAAVRQAVSRMDGGRRWSRHVRPRSK